MRSLAVALVVSASAAAQTTYTWQGGSGAWTDSTQWSPSGVPGSATGDTAIVTGGRATLGAAPAHPLAALSVTGGGTLALNGTAWTLAVDGAVVVGAGADAGTLLFDDDEAPGGFITLSCDSLQIETAGTVSADGTGYPGAPAMSGFAGSGPGGGTGVTAPSGNAPGAAHAGYGCSANTAGGVAYGDPFHADDPGSGGAATQASPAGGNGGGRVRVVAASQITVRGSIDADGQPSSASGGAGAGGSIWLTTAALNGGGQVHANGGVGQCASGGRIVVDGLTSAATGTTLRTTGGTSCCNIAGSGTIMLITAAGESTLILDSGARSNAFPTPLPSMLVTHLVMNNSVAISLPPGGELRVSQDAVVQPNADIQFSTLVLRANRIQLDGAFRGDAFGYPGGYQNGAGPGHAVAPDDGGAVGGSHGGLGALAPQGSTYGAAASPVDMGSSGTVDITLSTAAFRGGNGGGALRLFAGTELDITGSVSAGGQGTSPQCPGCSGGAGGSIWLTAPLLSGSGVVSATGATGGGGGRVAVYADQSTFTGTLSAGGAPGMDGAGQPGTVVAPAADSLISLDAPPEGFTAEGTFSFSGFALPAGGQFVVFVDDDERLGDGSDTPNAPDQSEPMRRVTSTGGSVTVDGLTPGHRYFWNVVALDSGGAVLAGSALASFIACAGAGCGGPPPADGGFTLPDGGVLEVGPPLFVSTPEGFGACGMPYVYSRAGRPQVAGAGPFHFSVEPAPGDVLPSGVSVDPDTGAVQWTPTSAQEGVQRFDLVVTGRGGTARQPLDVVVVCRDAASPNVKCGCSDGGAALTLLALLALIVRSRRVAR